VKGPWGRIALLFLLTVPLAVGQNIDMAAVRGEEEFQRGVRAYHQGRVSQAILAFTESLSHQPQDPRTRVWLGHAYYRSGFEDAALSQWDYAGRLGADTAYLRFLRQVVEDRRNVDLAGERDRRYVVAGELSGTPGNIRIFSRPTSLRPRPDGSFYLTSFATHEVLILDVNGVSTRQLSGGVLGFSQPYDIMPLPSGDLVVSEFGADRLVRLSPGGRRITEMGSRGTGAGELLGPQYLAVDDGGFIYVTDWGNRRVSKFSSEGEFLLSFGRRTPGFAGFSAPTGIVAFRGSVYVADARRRSVAEFDESGNFIREIADIGLERPEMLSVYDARRLLVADGNRVALLDVDHELLEPVSTENALGGRLTGAVLDQNGNILVSDFEEDQVYFLSESSTLFSGLFVHVERVIAEDFPRVFVELSVADRLGNPIVGLRNSNFLAMENGRRLDDLQLVGAPDQESQTSFSLLIEGSPGVVSRHPELQEALEGTLGAMGADDRRNIVLAADSPVAFTGAESSRSLYSRHSGVATTDWYFDLGLRDAAMGLLTHPQRRAIVFFSSGSLPDHAFDRYGLPETAELLKNNQISFSVVYLSPSASSLELDYLVRETGGSSAYVYQEEGVRPVVDAARRVPGGRYLLRYNSTSQTDFGRAYLPLVFETYLFRKSGRGELGYYPPLEF
jgi:DNA-binding beta-propeller fold protein YncE